MSLQEIKKRLESQSILYSEDQIHGRPTVIGYDKKFKWQWIATQLNTFLVAIDYGKDQVTVESIESAQADSFVYAKKHYNGWPHGLQSGLGVITILMSAQIDTDAIEYCQKLKSGKKWAGFAVPVVIDSSNNQIHSFDKNPIWGRIYYPYFKDLISNITGLSQSTKKSK
ncbi:MAG: hypothetical protein P8179_22940 [Candidatus Thiodiazotropha sp.]|jgi:hypothetical protein